MGNIAEKSRGKQDYNPQFVVFIRIWLQGTCEILNYIDFEDPLNVFNILLIQIHSPIIPLVTNIVL